MIDPKDQYQVNDWVVITEFGIITQVSGYLFADTIGQPPRLAQYRLACGLVASPEWLRRATAEEITRMRNT